MPAAAATHALYDVLGVPQTASHDEIRKAYKKKALATHPDRAPADKKEEAGEAFRAVAAAYEILSDPAKREEYDARGDAPASPPPGPQRQEWRRQRTQSRPTFPGQRRGWDGAQRSPDATFDDGHPPFPDGPPFPGAAPGPFPAFTFIFAEDDPFLRQFAFADPFTLFEQIFEGAPHSQLFSSMGGSGPFPPPQMVFPFDVLPAPGQLPQMGNLKSAPGQPGEWFSESFSHSVVNGREARTYTRTDAQGNVWEMRTQPGKGGREEERWFLNGRPAEGPPPPPPSMIGGPGMGPMGGPGGRRPMPPPPPITIPLHGQWDARGPGSAPFPPPGEDWEHGRERDRQGERERRDRERRERERQREMDREQHRQREMERQREREMREMDREMRQREMERQHQHADGGGESWRARLNPFHRRSPPEKHARSASSPPDGWARYPPHPPPPPPVGMDRPGPGPGSYGGREAYDRGPRSAPFPQTQGYAYPQPPPPQTAGYQPQAQATYPPHPPYPPLPQGYPSQPQPRSAPYPTQAQQQAQEHPLPRVPPPPPRMNLDPLSPLSGPPPSYRSNPREAYEPYEVERGGPGGYAPGPGPGGMPHSAPAHKRGFGLFGRH
ncbi:DnaJ-domain-containing protein [Calocera viscosa TUFC12733]|uniref:DnaJ-domain-containing protein n=1 Tax=Calocera viscosa (strain TUFC12733) TaxID=1330018 RepID=A0A167S5T2_CALVF|nr:DnaJ-domain-containing protein [Calocera viscosa TUFC12733]